MLLLTWHGTILRVEQAQSRLIHVPLVPLRAVSADYVVDLPTDAPETLPLTVPGGLTLLAGPQPGTLHLRRGGLFLGAGARPGTAEFQGTLAGADETFLPLTAMQAAVLRALLAGGWEQPEPPVSRFTLEPGFMLASGALRLNLADAVPGMAAPGVLHVPFAGTPLDLKLGAAPAPAEIHLRRLKPKQAVAESVSDLQTTPDSGLALPAETTLYLPPLMPSLAERDWLMDRAPATAPAVGPVAAQARVLHHTHAFVLLEPGLEGTVLGAAGLLSDAAFLDRHDILPDYMAREGSEIFLRAAFLQGAALLRGPHAIFYPPGLNDPFTWLVDCVVPLCALQEFLPPGTSLLVPAAPGTNDLNGAKLAWLNSFGLAGVQRAAIAAPICVAESLFSFEAPGLDMLPPSLVRAARDRAIALLAAQDGPRRDAAHRRILVSPAKPRRFSNRRLVEAVATQAELEVVSLDAMAPAQRIRLFNECDLIVAPSGGDLAHILFCRPGAAVLELSPECAYQPRVNQLAAKLDLVHGILPCPSAGDRIDGDLTVQPARLRVMLEMMGARAGLRPVAAP